MKAFFLLLATMVVAIAAQNTPIGSTSGGSNVPTAGGTISQPTGGTPVAGTPTSGVAGTQVGQGGGLNGPYQQFLQQYQQPQLYYPPGGVMGPTQGAYQPQYFPQHQSYYPSQQMRQPYAPRRQPRRNTFNPMKFYMLDQTDNPMVRYMILTGQPFNPFMFLLNN